MQKLNYYFGLMSVAFAACLSSCSSDDDAVAGSKFPSVSDRNVVLKGEMKQSQLLGFVYDTNGNPLSGVTVGSGTNCVVTDVCGSFALPQIEDVNGRTVVDLKKDGYYDVVRSFSTTDKANWEIVMVSKDDAKISAQVTYNSSTAKTLKTSDGMQVKMPANGYVNAATGEAYSGQVTTDLLYLNPDDSKFSDMMPGGDLAAVRFDNSEAQLVSYGMILVNMSDANGNKLQLKEGSEAALTFPIPSSLSENTPNEIPLWSFNEQTGLWEEEGVAALQGDVYVGNVKHFSWVNLDWPEIRCTVKGIVKDASGRVLPYQRVHVGQVYTYTDKNGEYKVYIPENTAVVVSVDSKDYSNYSPVVEENVKAQKAMTEITVNLQLPTLSYVSGKLVNAGEGSLLSTVWISYEGKTTKSSHTGLDGSFEIISPMEYKGPATLNIRTGSGEVITRQITLTGEDLSLGDIKVKIDTPAGEGGTLYVTTDSGKKFEYGFGDASSAMSGAVIVDNRLMISSPQTGEKDWDNPDFEFVNWYIDIYDYSPGKKQYTGQFDYSIEGGSKFVRIGSIGDGVNFNVKENGDVINMDMNGRAMFMYRNGVEEDYDEYDQMRGNAEILASGLSFNVIVKGETKRNIGKGSVPSFTPFIADTYPIGIIYSKSSMFDRGAELHSDGTYEDVKNLVDIVKKNGFVQVDDDEAVSPDNPNWWNGTFYNYKTNSLVEIQWSSYYSFNDSISSAYNMYSPITVSAVEGLKINVKDIGVYLARKRVPSNESLWARRRK